MRLKTHLNMRIVVIYNHSTFAPLDSYPLLVVESTIGVVRVLETLITDDHICTFSYLLASSRIFVGHRSDVVMFEELSNLPKDMSSKHVEC